MQLNGLTADLGEEPLSQEMLRPVARLVSECQRHYVVEALHGLFEGPFDLLLDVEGHVAAFGEEFPAADKDLFDPAVPSADEVGESPDGERADGPPSHREGRPAQALGEIVSQAPAAGQVAALSLDGEIVVACLAVRPQPGDDPPGQEGRDVGLARLDAVVHPDVEDDLHPPFRDDAALVVVDPAAVGEHQRLKGGDFPRQKEFFEEGDGAEPLFLKTELHVLPIFGEMELEGPLVAKGEAESLGDGLVSRCVDAVKAGGDGDRGGLLLFELLVGPSGLGRRLEVGGLGGRLGRVGSGRDDIVVHPSEEEADAAFAGCGNNGPIQLVAFSAVEVVGDHDGGDAQAEHPMKGAKRTQVDFLGPEVGAEAVDGVAAPGGQIPPGVDDVGVERLFGVAVGVEVPRLEEEAVVIGPVRPAGCFSLSEGDDEPCVGCSFDPAPAGGG